ncbi:MAG TPA: zf-HC2 domain-containing protein [Steroidobacteraceae bacterium]|nr:zf-HC2 domain-containing protein [Steroidobacteraceae bacterium]
MTGPDPHEPEVHAVALLLPWYVTGTLNEHERRQADEHLATCASCRAELEELQVMRSQVREVSADQPVPEMLGAVKARIRPDAPPVSKPPSSSVADFLRALFAPNWVPTAAVLLILVQSGALVWMNQRARPGDEVMSRGLASPATRVGIVFQPTAAEQDIRRMLVEARARIVAGPSADGAYIIELPTRDPERVEQKLAALRGHADVVRSAERTTQ